MFSPALKDIPVESFTAAAAEKLGLINAFNIDTVKVKGVFALSKSGVEFESSRFVFFDDNGNLRAGEFANGKEFLKFMELFKNEIDN